MDNVLFVKIGTGIGGAIIADGRLYRGTQGCAGDIGHICADLEGPVCPCGNRGCLEVMAAAPAIVAKAERCAMSGASTTLRRTLEERGGLDARDVGTAAAFGDHHTLDIIRESGRNRGSGARDPRQHAQPVAGDRGRRRGQHRVRAPGRDPERRLPLLAPARHSESVPVVLSELDGMAGVAGASVLAAEGVLQKTGAGQGETNAASWGWPRGQKEKEESVRRMRRAASRRDFLMLGGAGAALLGSAACGGSQGHRMT